MLRYNTDPDTLRNVFNSFYKYIVNDAINKIQTAAEKGYGKTNLYVYKKGEQFTYTSEDGEEYDYHVVYLLKGPKPDGLSYFTKMGLKPVMTRIEDNFMPFCVHHWYAGNNQNIVEITWEEKSISLNAEKENRIDQLTDDVTPTQNAMKDLVEKMSELSKNNKHERESILKEKETVRQDLKTTCDNFYDMVIKNMRDKIRKAAEQGHGKTNIYNYAPGEKFGGHFVVFLLKGPDKGYVKGLKYFRRKGITPIMDRLTEELNPFYVVHWYVGNKKNIIEVTWMVKSVAAVAVDKFPNRVHEIDNEIPDDKIAFYNEIESLYNDKNEGD